MHALDLVRIVQSIGHVDSIVRNGWLGVASRDVSLTISN